MRYVACLKTGFFTTIRTLWNFCGVRQVTWMLFSIAFTLGMYALMYNQGSPKEISRVIACAYIQLPLVLGVCTDIGERKRGELFAAFGLIALLFYLAFYGGMY